MSNRRTAQGHTPRALFGVLTLLLVVGAPQLSAQTVIRGTVVDDESGAPIEGGALRLVTEAGAVERAFTDEAGGFELTLAQTTPWALEFDRIGYERIRSAALDLASSAPVEVEFRIPREPVALVPLVVRTRPGSGEETFRLRRDGWGRGVFLDADDLAALDMRRAVDFFDGVDGTVVTWRFGADEAAIPRPLPRVRSFTGNSCFHYLVDDAPMRIGDGGNPWGRYPLAGLKPEQIRAVEVYPSPVDVPPEIHRWTNRIVTGRAGDLSSGVGDRWLCGVVVIWTGAGW